MPADLLAALLAIAGPAPAAGLADLPPPAHDPARAREAADEILSRSEYQWGDDGGTVLDRVAEWVAEQVSRLTAPFGVGGGGLPVWVGWLVLALLAALVGFLIYRSRAGWQRDPARGARGGGRVVVTGEDETIDWAAEAARCEAEGRWREAQRARYRVLVGELAARRIIGDLVGRTAGELVAEVASTAPAVAPSFAAATELFEAAWYGGAPVGPAERDRFARRADATLAAAERAPAPRAVPA